MSPEEPQDRTRQALRAAFGAAWVDRVVRTLAEEDPVGLVALGAPPSEYDIEAYDLLPHLAACRSSGDVRDRLHATFERCMGARTAGSKETYTRAASRIWSLWEQKASDRADEARRPFL